MFGPLRERISGAVERLEGLLVGLLLFLLFLLAVLGGEGFGCLDVFGVAESV